jgi:hypothetical protein
MCRNRGGRSIQFIANDDDKMMMTMTTDSSMGFPKISSSTHTNISSGDVNVAQRCKMAFSPETLRCESSETRRPKLQSLLPARIMRKTAAAFERTE